MSTVHPAPCQSCAPECHRYNPLDGPADYALCMPATLCLHRCAAGASCCPHILSMKYFIATHLLALSHSLPAVVWCMHEMLLEGRTPLS